MEYQEQNNFVDNCDVSKCRLWNDNFKIMKCSGMRKCEGTDCLFKSKALREVARKQTEIIQRQTQTILEFKNEIDRLKNLLENTLEYSDISCKSRMEMLKTKEELQNTIAELTEKLEVSEEFRSSKPDEQDKEAEQQQKVDDSDEEDRANDAHKASTSCQFASVTFLSNSTSCSSVMSSVCVDAFLITLLSAPIASATIAMSARSTS